MPVDPGGHFHQAGMSPLRYRVLPGQIEEVWVPRANQEMWSADAAYSRPLGLPRRLLDTGVRRSFVGGGVEVSLKRNRVR
jgi:hypothetical protein